MFFSDSVILVLGVLADSAQAGTIYSTLAILIILFFLSPAIIWCLWSVINSKPKHVASNRTPYDGKRSQYAAKRRQQYDYPKSWQNSHSNVSDDYQEAEPKEEQVPSPPVNITQPDQEDRKKLLKSRLDKFGLSEKEAELVFSFDPTWRHKLGSPSNVDNEFVLPMMIAHNIVFDYSYTKRIFHIIDKAIQIVDSIWNENPESITNAIREGYTNALGSGFYEEFLTRWNYFKKHKKPYGTTSGNQSAEFVTVFSKSEAYNELDLETTTSIQKIKNKFRILAKKHHPDRGGSREKFVKIAAAYEAIIENGWYTA